MSANVISVIVVLAQALVLVVLSYTCSVRTALLVFVALLCIIQKLSINLVSLGWPMVVDINSDLTFMQECIIYRIRTLTWLLIIQSAKIAHVCFTILFIYSIEVLRLTELAWPRGFPRKASVRIVMGSYLNQLVFYPLIINA